jgi:YVTN family beta-propeller protein
MKNPFSRVLALCGLMLWLTTTLYSVTLVTKIHVGRFPSSPVVNSTTHRLYTLNEVDQSISVVDTTSYTVLDTIPFPVQILGMDINPITNMLYVTSLYPSGVVYVINAADDTVVTTIPVGNGASGVAVNSITNRVYACNYLDNTVSVIDGSSNTVIDTISLPAGAEYSAVDTTANYVYIASKYGYPINSTVYVIDASSDTLIQTVTLPGQIPNAAGIVVDHSLGQAYVADNNNGTLDIIDINAFSVKATVTGVDSCDTLALNPGTHAILVANDSLTDGPNVAAINGTTFKLTGRIHAKRQVTGVVVDPSTSYINIAMENGGLAVFH